MADERITNTNWAAILRDKMIKNQGLPVMGLELADIISDDPDNALIQGLDGKLFTPKGAIPYVLYLARIGEQAVLTREKPTEDQQVIPRIFRSATWGEWSDVAILYLSEDLLRQEAELVLGDIFTSKLWISSDIEIPNAQLRLSVIDKTDGVELATAFSQINLNNINTTLTPVTFLNKFKVSRQISLSQIQMTLSVMVLAPGTQFGVVSIVSSMMSFLTIFSSGSIGQFTMEEIIKLKNLLNNK